MGRRTHRDARCEQTQAPCHYKTVRTGVRHMPLAASCASTASRASSSARHSARPEGSPPAHPSPSAPRAAPPPPACRPALLAPGPARLAPRPSAKPSASPRRIASSSGRAWLATAAAATGSAPASGTCTQVTAPQVGYMWDQRVSGARRLCPLLQARSTAGEAGTLHACHKGLCGGAPGTVTRGEVSVIPNPYSLQVSGSPRAPAAERLGRPPGARRGRRGRPGAPAPAAARPGTGAPAPAPPARSPAARRAPALARHTVRLHLAVERYWADEASYNARRGCL